TAPSGSRGTLSWWSTPSSSRTSTSTSSRPWSTICRWRSPNINPAWPATPARPPRPPPPPNSPPQLAPPHGETEGNRHGNLFSARHADQIEPERSHQQGGRPAEDAESDRPRDAESARRGQEAGRHVDRRREAPQEAVGRPGRPVEGVGAEGDAR